MSRSLFKKGHYLEESTPPPMVAAAPQFQHQIVTQKKRFGVDGKRIVCQMSIACTNFHALPILPCIKYKYYYHINIVAKVLIFKC